jgi:hypothetical protein
MQGGVISHNLRQIKSTRIRKSPYCSAEIFLRKLLKIVRFVMFSMKHVSILYLHYGWCRGPVSEIMSTLPIALERLR